MKNFLVLFLSFFFLSCTVTKKVTISKLSITEIKDFYNQNKFDLKKILLVKDTQSYINLSNKDLNVLPNIIIFDKDGEEILFKKENYCRADLEEFISEYDNGKIENINKGKNNIIDYLNNFKPLTESTEYTIENIKKIQKNVVFINTASYSNVFNINKESFKLSKINSKNFEIFLINVDLQKDWKIENIKVKN